MVHLDLRISPRIFEKVRNNPHVIFRGLGEDYQWQKSEAKKSCDTALSGPNGGETTLNWCTYKNKRESVDRKAAEKK